MTKDVSANLKSDDGGRAPVHREVMWLIECRTGCSCCQHENHRRGPYLTREDAEKRIAYFKSDDSKFWPVASQYARRGRYVIEFHEPEILGDDRYIIEDEVFHGGVEFVAVNDDGSVDDNKSEQFD